MVKLSRLISLLLISFCMMAYSGCGTGQQKQTDTSTATVDAEALKAFNQEQQELLQMANAEIAAFNKKIIELNNKIKTKGTKLTDAQNKAIDSFEHKRASMNQRIHQIKNVTYSDWSAFKAKFEADLEECCKEIDALLADL